MHAVDPAGISISGIHSLHPVAPASLEKNPVSHKVHEVAPSLDAKLPAMHDMQDVEPASVY